MILEVALKCPPFASVLANQKLNQFFYDIPVFFFREIILELYNKSQVLRGSSHEVPTHIPPFSLRPTLMIIHDP